MSMEDDKSITVKNKLPSLRLRTIADMVPPADTLADIGCDHGYLIIYLVETGRIRRGIAADVRPGPLSRAESHIREAGLQDRIETRLSDGFCQFRPGEADSAVIAGMGGRLICRILEESREVTARLQSMVLSPHSEPETVRRVLCQMGFAIRDERFVQEDGKTYPVILAENVNYLLKMSAQKAGCCDDSSPMPLTAEDAADVSMSLEELYYGPVLLARKDPVLYRFLEKRLSVCRDIQKEIRSAGSHADGRLAELGEEESRILSAMRRYETAEDH